ncbi:C1 family peptidase [Arthrobacter sp. G.S.26]|uniref:C1 family peptidase n=1 Tax=Arthrobacter sp. G.S.26 TaxID=3433706 RepID=UPI003D780B6F
MPLPPRPGLVSVSGHTFLTDVVPDVFDQRDLEYRPRLQPLPHAMDARPGQHFVLTQVGSSCTGHAVAAMINTVLAAGPDPIRVSPYMIYSLARRYDEFAGDGDEGSSLRGALKGWFYHGVLPEQDWPSLAADPQIDLHPDLAAKALQHPLGAFYRVNAFRLDDMQSAITELNAVAASARVHSGWLNPTLEHRDDGTSYYRISRPDKVDQLGGHAFSIVGYNDVGFLVQNSWGKNWGGHGFATLPYEDWLTSAYDAWVARPGVPSVLNLHGVTKVVTATTGGLAQGPGPDLERLKDHVVNLSNEGRLSTSGRFISTGGQIDRIFQAMAASHSAWQQAAAGGADAVPRRIVFYAHGGLVDEEGGLRVAQAQLNWWLNNRVYPVSFAWQSGPIETLTNHLRDVTGGLIPFGGLGFDLVEQVDRLVEKIAHSRLAWMWAEMKENATRSSGNLPGPVSWNPVDSAAMENLPGASLVVSRLRAYLDEVAPVPVEVHLVAHSAGAIFTAHMLARLQAEQIPVASLCWLGPAIRIDDFERLVMPALQTHQVEKFTSFGLSEASELDDVVGAGPLNIYQKSLLYLVSRGLESGGETPLVGLQRHVSESASLTALARDRLAKFFWSPSQNPVSGRTSATTHGGLDEDMFTMTSVLLQILGTSAVTTRTTFRPFTALDSPGASGAAASDVQTVNVQQAGAVPVTRTGHQQTADDPPE